MNLRTSWQAALVPFAPPRFFVWVEPCIGLKHPLWSWNNWAYALQVQLWTDQFMHPIWPWTNCGKHLSTIRTSASSCVCALYCEWMPQSCSFVCRSYALVSTVTKCNASKITALFAWRMWLDKISAFPFALLNLTQLVLVSQYLRPTTVSSVLCAPCSVQS